ncbi:MAG: pseudouridine synthase [Angelakisella sp.]
MKDEAIRLDKALSEQGTLSRKDAGKLITKGLVTVNGAVVRDTAAKVCRLSDCVSVNGVAITMRKHIYLLLNKPLGVVSATSDPNDKTVIDLVPPELWRNGLFPAGRLDKDTVGMVIITDDGDFAHRILSPKSHIPKTYLATLDIPVTAEMEAGFNAGISLKGEKECMPAKLSILDEHTARVVIHEGMYHQIKRMFGCYGAKVVELRRVAMGSLPLDEALSEGCCRELTPAELELLTKS